MNFLLMLGMMGLMLIFFHGRGHHQPSSGPTNHAVKSAGVPAPTEAPAASRPSGVVRRAEPKPDPAGTPEGTPVPPATPPPTPQAE